MHEVKVAEAKAQLSALLDRVERGEEITIARRGKRIARLVPARLRPQSAASALKPIWAMGGFKLDSIPDLPLDNSAVNLD